MSDILPPDALLPMRQYLTFVGRNTEPHEVQPNSPFDMIRRLVDSHEALRARLAEVEADRDRWHAAYEEEVEVGGARLAAVEGERDEAIAALELGATDEEWERGTRDQYRNISKGQLWNALKECRRRRRRLGEQLRDIGDTIRNREARLAEAVELLRGVVSTAELSWPLAFDLALDTARVFIEEQGQ